MNLAIHHFNHHPQNPPAADKAAAEITPMNPDLQAVRSQADATLAEAAVLLAMGALSGALIPLLIVARESATAVI